MKAAYKKLTNHGSINIPVAMRREIGLEGGDPMEVSREGGEIVIRQYLPRCVFCGEREEVKEFYARHICSACIGKIINQFKEENNG